VGGALRTALRVLASRGHGAECRPSPPAAEPRDDPELRALRRRWADLIRRIYEVDPLVCPRCGAPMRIIACITEPKVIATIRRHLASTGLDAREPPLPPTSTRPHGQRTLEALLI